MTFDIIVASDNIAFIPFFAEMTSTPTSWREEHRWNVSVLQRLDLSSFAMLVFFIQICSQITDTINMLYFYITASLNNIECQRVTVVVLRIKITYCYIYDVSLDTRQ
jgi:hypothetical protein